jgi:hypothetical protein
MPTTRRDQSVGSKVAAAPLAWIRQRRATAIRARRQRKEIVKLLAKLTSPTLPPYRFEGGSNVGEAEEGADDLPVLEFVGLRNYASRSVPHCPRRWHASGYRRRPMDQHRSARGPRSSNRRELPPTVSTRPRWPHVPASHRTCQARAVDRVLQRRGIEIARRARASADPMGPRYGLPHHLPRGRAKAFARPRRHPRIAFRFGP